MSKSSNLPVYRIGFLCAVTACLFGIQNQSPAKDKHAQAANGAQIYKQHCAQCHADGGNSVNPLKPVAESGQLKSLPQFKAYLSSPPGHMPYYQDVVSNKHVLSALYKYCKTLKKPPHQVGSAAQLH